MSYTCVTYICDICHWSDISHNWKVVKGLKSWVPLVLNLFCNANIVIFTRHLATKLIIFIHAKHKINGILGYHFSLFLCRLHKNFFNLFNPLCANFTKWSNIFKQFVGKLLTNCLSVFDHFMGLVLKGLSLLAVLTRYSET